MAGEPTRSDDAALAQSEVHDVLSNERRRKLLRLLQERDRWAVRDLSERVAEMETGESPAPRDVRQSVYVTLQQTHLPRLESLGVVTLEEDGVTLAEHADEVTVYMEVVPKYGLSWAEYYLGVAVLGLVGVVGAAAGTPGLAAVGASSWAALCLGLVGASAAYQVVRQGSALVDLFAR